MQSKMNNYAWWETDGDTIVLMFKQFYDAEEIARLYRDEDLGWCYDCKLRREKGECLYDAEMSESDAKAAIIDMVSSRMEAHVDYCKDMLEKFTSQEGAE